MPKKKKIFPEDKKFDQIAKFLFGGKITYARKKLKSRIFHEWLELHPEISNEALAPPASSEDEIIQLISSIILREKEVTLKELLNIVKPKSIIKTQKILKIYLKKINFPSSYEFTYPRALKGTSRLILAKKSVSIADFLFQLHQAYESVPSKMGDMVELPVLGEILAQETGWTINKIYEQIYLAYLDKKVDLQPGKVTKGEALEAEDGSKFFWFQFR